MNHQRLQSYAAVAEVFGAFAIVVSLVWAGLEFRRSNTLTGLDVDLVLYEREQEHNRMLVEVDGLAELVLLAGDDGDALSPADRLRYLEYQHDFLDSWEIAFSYREQGIMDDDAFEAWDEWFAREVRSMPEWVWTENRHNFVEGPFTEHVDATLGVRSP